MKIDQQNEQVRQKYTKVRKLGEGTYAVVYEGLKRDASAKQDGLKVAIKKIKVTKHQDGIDLSAIREIKTLRELQHPNIISCLDVFSQGNNINIVLEFLEVDLEMLIKDRVVFSPADIKSWMKMLMAGLAHLHRNWILHRDIKPNNLLLSQSGCLKIADFGMSRYYGPPNLAMTSKVITLWYRPPELMYGAKLYTGAVDVWSAGCVFAELMLRVPFFAGTNELDQLKKIFMALGTPTESQWPGMSLLPSYLEFKKYPPTPLRSMFTAASTEALELLGSMLSFDPLKRPLAEEVLNHKYFHTGVECTPPSQLPKPTVSQKRVNPSSSSSSSDSAEDSDDHGDNLIGKKRKIE